MFSFRKTCKSVRLKKKKVTTVSAMSENDVQNRIHFWNIKAHGINSVPARQFPSEWHHLFLMQWTQEWPQALRSWLKKNHWSPWLKYSYRRTRHECDSCSHPCSLMALFCTTHHRHGIKLDGCGVFHPSPLWLVHSPEEDKALKKQKRSSFLIFNCWGSLKCICGELHCTVTTATKLIWALDYCSSLKEASLRIPGLWAHSSDLHAQFTNIWDFSDRFQ